MAMDKKKLRELRDTQDHTSREPIQVYDAMADKNVSLRRGTGERQVYDAMRGETVTVGGEQKQKKSANQFAMDADRLRQDYESTGRLHGNGGMDAAAAGKSYRKNRTDAVTMLRNLDEYDLTDEQKRLAEELLAQYRGQAIRAGRGAEGKQRGETAVRGFTGTLPGAGQIGGFSAAREIAATLPAVQKRMTRQEQEDAAEREASGYVSPENYEASARANEAAARRIQERSRTGANGSHLRAADGGGSLTEQQQALVDDLTQRGARDRAMGDAQEAQTASFRGSEYWLERANELEEKNRRSRNGYGGMMQGGEPFSETPKFTGEDRRDWDKAREYYYQVKNAERWNSMPEYLRSLAIEAAGYTTDSTWSWQRGDEAALAGMDPAQRADVRKGERARRDEIAAKLTEKGYDAEEVLEYASRLRNAERMQQELEGLTAEVTGEGVGGVLRGIAGTAESAVTNLLSPIGSVGLLAQRVFRGGVGAEHYRPVDYNTPSMYLAQGTGAARGAIGDELGTVGKYLYDTANSAIDSAARMLVGQAVGTGLIPDAVTSEAAARKLESFITKYISTQMSGEVFANAFVEAKQSGATDSDAILDSMVAATIENLTETYSVEAILRNPHNLLRKALAHDFISEGSEEIASDILNTIYDELKNGEDSDLRTQYQNALASGATTGTAFNRVFGDYLKQLFLDGLAGGLSGLAMGGVAQIGENARYAGIYSDPENAKALMDEVREVNPDLAALKKAEDRIARGKQLTGYQARELVGRSEEALSPLKEKSKKYGKQSGAMQSTYQQGQDVQQYDEAYHVAYEMGKAGTNLAAAQQSQATQYLTENQRRAAWEAGRDSRGSSDAADIANRRALVDGKIADVQSLSIKDGTVMAEIKVGDAVRTEALADLKMDAGTRMLAEDAQKYGTAAKTVFEQYEAAQQLTNYLRSADIAVTVGMASPSASAEAVIANLKSGEISKTLSGAQIEALYKAGQQAGKTQLRQTGMTRLGTGSFTMEQSARGTRMDSRQRAAVRFLRDLSKVTGLDISVYKSSADSQGRLQGANGMYKDGHIRIDLNAGAMQASDLSNAAMLRTASHELTHFMAETAPSEYQALQSFLVEKLSAWDGHSIQDLVEEKMANAERNRRSITSEQALEEVVADGCEMMLRDSKAIRQLAEENRTLFEKVRDWMTRFFDALRKAFEGVEAVHPESIHMMENYAEELQKLWDDALTAAAKNAHSASESIGIDFDAQSDSVAPAVMNSERTWTASDYVQERETAAREIAKAIGVSVRKAKDYIDSINSIAKMIAEDRTRLDYFSSPGRSSFVGNVEYGGSFDFSTLCKKRRLLTGTFSAIQKALPNTALTANEILDIRNRMKEKGLEVSCGLCYVEGSRANMGKFAKEFLNLYKKYYPDAWQPNMADVNTPDGIEWVRLNHPECYEQYEYFWNHYGTLRAEDKTQFASQQKPKLYQLHTEYKGEILDKFKSDGNVETKNRNGGIRLQSFSDFEIVHLIDTMQIIMDMSRVGLAGQAYTKVPDFAWALGDTGLKINLSLIAKDVDANGKLVFDEVEGMPIDQAMALRDRYSANVGTILVVFNDQQLLAAMADDRVDFIIPFHRSQWKKAQYSAMGLPARTKDYTYQQNEKYIKPQYHEYRGRMVRDNASNYMPNEYWDFSKSGKENAIAYLKMCAENNKRPKFYKLLQDNGDGSYSLKPDGSTDGYWKLLIDFKMYDNSGKGSPQMPVQPRFNMDEATRMLNDYKGGHNNFPVAHGVVDEFVRDYKESHPGVKYSDRAPMTTEQAEAEKRFGTTTDFNEAGFILPDGKMLRFTDDANAGARNYDHRAIGMMYGVDVDLTKNHGFNMESNRHMNRFVEDGGIRFDPGDPDYDMGAGMQLSKSKPLTKAQERTIRDFIAWKQERDATYVPPDEFAKYMGAQAPVPLTIEFGGGADIAVGARSRDLAAWNIPHLTYDGGQINADRVIADIRHYYETGELRKPSEVARFRYSERNDIVDVNGKEYDSVIILDKPISQREIKDRKKFAKYLARNLYDKKISVLDQNGDVEILEFAGRNEAVTKNGNRHKVRGKLEFVSGDTRRVIIANLEEIAEHSVYDPILSNNESSHGWLDQNGWESRMAYVTDGETVYEAFLKIGKSRDGRNILYAVNCDVKDGVAVDRSATQKRAAALTATPSKERIAQKPPAVKRQERDTASAEIATLQRDLRQMQTELKRLKAGEVSDFARVAQYDAKEAGRAAKQDAKVAREEGVLAGQMAQGRMDAKAMRRAEERNAAQVQRLKERITNAKEAGNAKAERVAAEKNARIERLEQRIADTRARLNARITEQRQRLETYRANRNETEAARGQRAQVEKRLDTLTKMLTTNNDKLHVPEQLKKPVQDLLNALMPSRFSQSMLEQGVQTRSDERLIAALKKIRDVSISEQDGNASDLAYLDFPPEFLQDVDEIFRFASEGTEPLYDMNSEQLRELNKVLTTLNTSIRNINRLITAGHFESVREASAATVADLDRLRERKLHFGLDSTAGKAEDVLRNFLSWKNTTPYYAFNRFGEGGRDMFRRFMDGWDTFAFNADAIMNFVESTVDEKEIRAWEKEKLPEVQLESGQTIRLTIANAMELYELSKRKQAEGHLYGGGIRLSGQSVRPVQLTVEDVETLTAPLSARQKSVADALQQYMEMQGSEWGNEVTMQRFGYRYFTERGYYPLVSDRNELRARDTEAEQNSMFRLLNLSATKGLQEGANNAIVIGSIFDTFSNHMTDMAKYNALALPILDAMKWYNYRVKDVQEGGQFTSANVKQSLEAAYGKDALNYFSTFIKDLNGNSEGGYNRGEGFFHVMSSNAKVAAVAANLRVALLQPTAYVRAANVISPKYLAIALKNAPKALWTGAGNVFRGSENGLTGEMLRYSGIARWKSMGFYDTNIGRNVRDQIKGASSVRDTVVEKSMTLAELGDTSTWTVIWSACKEEQKAKGYTGERLLQETAERFREVVYSTQVVDSTMTRSHIMRSKSAFIKDLTAFMSEPTLSYNMLLDAALAIQTENRRGGNGWKTQAPKLFRAFSAFAATAAVSAIVESLSEGLRNDDDDDLLDKILAAFFGEKGYDGNLVQNLIPIDSLPYLNDFVSIIQGYSNERLDTTFMSKIVNMAKIWDETYKLNRGILDKPTAVTSYGSMTLWGKLYKSLDALSTTIGVPLAAMTREVTTIWNATIGAISPRMKIKRYESKDQKYEWAYKFALAGDMEAYEKEIEGLWKTFQKGKDKEEIADSIASGMQDVIKTHYLAGELTEEEAQELVTSYAGKDESKAEGSVQKWHFIRDTGLEPTSDTMAIAWFDTAQPAGIRLDVYTAAYEYARKAEADKDSDGKSISGSLKQKVVDYILGLGLTDQLERALWDALKGNWKDTDTPWE